MRYVMSRKEFEEELYSEFKFDYDRLPLEDKIYLSNVYWQVKNKPQYLVYHNDKESIRKLNNIKKSEFYNADDLYCYIDDGLLYSGSEHAEIPFMDEYTNLIDVFRDKTDVLYNLGTFSEFIDLIEHEHQLTFDPKDYYDED